jgi:polysaccharide deacetylase family protein (PEP-CTERM system associated)
MTYHILLTIDVEDWFQVENLRPACPVTSWSSYELRVEKNTHRLLDLLDEASLQRSAFRDPQGPEQSRRAVSGQRSEDSDQFPGSSIKDPASRNKVHATFFVLGWIAERLPNLVREICARGHEIASHGYSHELCTKCSPDDLREDMIKSRRLLEDIIGEEVYGYRAPSFSINDQFLEIVEQAGYMYDSSFNSFSANNRYGKINLSVDSKKCIATRISDGFFEIPISNLKIAGCTLPWGGGGYFRLMPTTLFLAGIRRILESNGAYVFYVHPWELDSAQPRVKGISWFYKFRHYINLENTGVKLTALINAFQNCLSVSCGTYLKEKAGARTA